MHSSRLLSTISAVISALGAPFSVLAQTAPGGPGSVLAQAAVRPLSRVTSATDTAVPLNAIERLQARLDANTLTLPFDSTLGYLPALLRVLGIPTSSQSLVFSRTSLQSDLIAPWSPRAVYFNDDVYIGYVPESTFLEVAVANPFTGAVFYSLNQDAHHRPRFLHEPVGCTQCHVSRATTNVSGFLMLSTLADRDGYAIASVHNGSTNDATPVEKRFGGWYVTGTHGTSGHSGNVLSPKLYQEIADKDQYLRDFNLTAESTRTDLAGRVSTARFVARYSDIVALMVLAHQTSVHNLMTDVYTTARQSLIEDEVISKYRGEPAGLEPLEKSNAKFRVAVNRLVRAMLFIDEAPLNGAIRESTSFTRDFAARGPMDRQGRSLREFDLERRLFKYPLSFLLYSDGFTGLPAAARAAVYRRIHEVLSGADDDPDFQRLSAIDRKAISEILGATLPEYAKVLSDGSI